MCPRSSVTHAGTRACASAGDRSTHRTNTAPFWLSTSEQISSLPSEGLFTLLKAWNIPSYSEGGAGTNINKRGWSYINSPCFESFCCCCVLTPDEHLQLQNVSERAGSVLLTAQESSSQSAMPSPAHLWGPDGLSLPERCCIIHSPCQGSLGAQQPPRLLELKNSPAPLCLDLNVLILLLSSLPFFSSLAHSEFHYSLSSQCLTTSTFIHINSEWQSLTICWECWQQIVS